MTKTVNCPKCGIGNNVLPNMRNKLKCRKCGVEFNPSEMLGERNGKAKASTPGSATQKGSLAQSPQSQLAPQPKPRKIPRKPKEQLPAPQPKPSEIPEHFPENVNHEIDYEI